MRYILSILILFSLAGMAAALPVLPDEFAGSVTAMESCTRRATITARIDWNERGPRSPQQQGVRPLDSQASSRSGATEEDISAFGIPDYNLLGERPQGR